MTQLALKYPVTTSYAIDDFVISSANQSAFEAIESWQSWSHPTLMIVGAAGSGKTHISKIFEQMSGAEYLDMANHRIALSKSIERTHKQPLILENIHAYCGDEANLFHLLNAFLTERRQLLITSEHTPHNLAKIIKTQDIISRLKTIPVQSICMPDDFLISAIYMKCFADRQLVFNPNILSTLTRYGPRNYSGIQAVINHIDQFTTEHKQKPSREVVKTIALQATSNAEADYFQQG